MNRSSDVRLTRSVLFAPAVPAALLVLSTPFAGAQSMAEEEEPMIEEVIVTATYRETDLMDTPQSISAVTDSLVEDLGGQSMGDIFTMVPGLSMQGGINGENRFTVRGVTSQTGGTGYFLTGATVGVYLDGTPVTAALGPDNQVSGTLFDIERVEVLKGPQGTLFGEGSQGGTIRYLYKQPDPTEFDAAVNVGYAALAESKKNSTRYDGMVNIPFGDGFALRLTGWDATTAGYIDERGTDGEITAEDTNRAARAGFRAALRYEGDRIAIAGTVYDSTQETVGSLRTARAYEAAAAPIVEGYANISTDEINIYSLVVEVDFDWANFQSMTSFTDRKIPSVINVEYTGFWGLDFVYGGSTLAADHPGCTPAISFGFCPGWPGFFNQAVPGSVIPDGRNLAAFVAFGNHYSERMVQEFRLVSPGDQRLRWTAGAFWKDSEDHTQNQQIGVYNPGREAFGQFFDPLLMVPANTHTDLLEEYAVFGEASYDLTDRLEVTAGLRVSDLQQYFSNTDSGTDDTPVSPKFVVAWRPLDELLVYFNYATGFRPGNVNNHQEFNVRQLEIQIQQAMAAGNTEGVPLLRQGQELSRAHRFFDGDHVSSYELGFKSTLLDGRMAILASAYYVDWAEMILVEDVPELRALTPGTSVYNTNSGGAEIQGFEMEVSAFVTERLAVRLAGDVVETEVSKGPLQSTASPEGAELIYAPNTSGSLAVDYTIGLNDGWSMVLHADRAYVAEQFANTQNTLTIPSYQKSNARITLRSADDKWRIAAYANNLSNNAILSGRSQQPIFYWFPPRQVGLEVGYNGN